MNVCSLYSYSGDTLNDLLFAAVDETLRKLEPTRMDISTRPECLAGTREDLLETIGKWVFLGPERVFWLYGLAGSGKSTISTTIATFFQEQRRLGAFVFCNRDIAERSEPSNVIRNLAFRLAHFNARLNAAVVAAIKNLPTIAESPLRLQFDKLLVEPLLELSDDEPPIVIILDALDECGNAESRAVLMALLAKESARLPPFVRIVITSRAENDIRTAFMAQPHVIVHEIDISSERNCEDILSFVRTQMAGIRASSPSRPMVPDWPGDTAIQAMTQRAGGLFVWASTACRFIDAHSPQKRLDILLRGDVNAKPELALDALYKTALEATGVLDDKELCSDFRAIMGIILVAMEPISHMTIDALFPLDSPSLYTIQKLGCVLRWSETDPTEPVRLLHPSFADFLMNRRRCNLEALHVAAAVHCENIAIGCIRHLDGVLKKNISNLVLSTTPVDVTCFPAVTAYASVHWVDHVCSITAAPDNLPDLLEQFLFRHFLHWVEVMSLLKKPRLTITLMKRLLDWLRVRLLRPLNGSCTSIIFADRYTYRVKVD